MTPMMERLKINEIKKKILKPVEISKPKKSKTKSVHNVVINSNLADTPKNLSAVTPSVGNTTASNIPITIKSPISFAPTQSSSVVQ
mmetsp:Transcript_32430/g.29236  ORF Transcript_32430/g.29236 Transcript_32430/m.29236 type:complete len:86 (+) Transcript_32430:791-1048(+)